MCANLTIRAALAAFLAIVTGSQSVHAQAQSQSKDDARSAYLPAPPVLYPGGVQSLRDVSFAELRGFRPLTLDLYLPPESGAPRPVVVFVHGGAWARRTGRDGGTFHDFPAVLASIAAQGYVVASVNYRLVGEVRFPGPVQDVEAAIRWLRMHKAEYNLDTTRFVLWGSSAGSQIATVIGTGCDASIFQPQASFEANEPAPSACVQGVIDWYGIIDLEMHAADMGNAADSGLGTSIDMYLGCKIANCAPGLARSASPLAYVGAKSPRFLIQHGAADATVSPKQSQRLYDALRAAGTPAEIVMYPNVAHGFARAPEGGPDEAVNKQALDKVVDWLTRYFPSQ